MDKKQKKQSTTKAANTGNSIQYALSKKHSENKRQGKKANIEFEHATLFLGQVFFHRKPPILLVFVVIKWIDISNGCQRVDRAEKRAEKTRKPHDIITSPDHAHDPAASHRIHTHTRSHTQTHTHCKSCNWHTRTLSVKQSTSIHWH